MKFGLPQNMRTCRKVQMIEVVVKEGQGTEDSLAREVTYFYREDGTLAAVSDPTTNLAFSDPDPVHGVEGRVAKSGGRVER